MSRKKHISLAIVSMFILLAMAISGTALYLTDRDAATNTVTVGDIKIDLQEPNWRDTYDVVPNQELRKDPQIKNTGVNDAIVFMTVHVPVEEITLTADNGTKGVKAPSELFWFKDTADGASTHANNFDSNWVHLDTKDTGADMSGLSRTYVFAYKTPLAANQTTSPLFDKIQIKNFIENEIMGGITEDIFINAYGIQASNVLESGVDLSNNLTTANLAKIYDIFITQSGYQLMHYYSTLNLAVTDANALTTDNADLPSRDGAACALHINGDTARLELISDVSSNSTVTLTQKTEFNMANHKLTLGDQSSFVAEKDLDIKNGSIEGRYKTMLDASSGTLKITNLDVINSMNVVGTCLNLQSSEVIINGLNIDYTIDMPTSVGSGYPALQLVNNEHVEINNCTIDIQANVRNQFFGSYLYNVQDAKINNLTTNLRGTTNSQTPASNMIAGIVTNGGNAEINNSTIYTYLTNDSTTSSAVLYGMYLNNSIIKVNNTHIDTNGHNFNKASLGVLSTGKTIISDSDIIATNSNKDQIGVQCRGEMELLRTNITATNQNNSNTGSGGVSVFGESSTCRINGGEIFAKCSTPDGSGDSNGNGVNVKNNNRLIIGDILTNTVVSGGNCAVGAADTSSVEIYGGLFKSPNHGGMYVSSKGNVNIHGGTFQNITDPSDPNYSSQISHFGGFYVYSDSGNVNINNATIIGGQHGLRIKEHNGSTAHVTIDNSSVSGQINAFSIDNGTLEIGSGVTTSYSSNDIQRNGGTVIDHRS